MFPYSDLFHNSIVDVFKMIEMGVVASITNAIIGKVRFRIQRSHQNLSDYNAVCLAGEI